MICIRATRRREPKKGFLAQPSTDPNGSQVGRRREALGCDGGLFGKLQNLGRGVFFFFGFVGLGLIVSSFYVLEKLDRLFYYFFILRYWKSLDLLFRFFKY